MMDNIYFENFCGNDSVYDAFWAPNLSIYTQQPDLTRCFQYSVLAIIPVAFLVISSFFYLIYLSEYTLVHRWNNFSNLLLLKLIALILLIAVTCVEIFISIADRANVPAARYVALICNLLGYVLALLLTQYTYRKRVNSSGVIFIYWLLSVIMGSIHIRSLHLQNLQGDMDVLWMSAVYMQFIFVCVEFLASLFSDTGALKMVSTPSKDLTEMSSLIDDDSEDGGMVPEELADNSCPQQRASFISAAFFAWFTPKVLKGFRKTLEMTEVWNVQRENSCNYIVPKFRKAWNQELQLLGETEREQCNAFFELNNTVNNNNSTKQQKRRPNAGFALFKVIGAYFCSAGILLLIHDIIEFISPQILRLLIVFVASKDPFIWHGYLYAVILFVLTAMNVCLSRHHTNIAYTVGMRVRSALSSAIYRKSLCLDKSSKNTSSTGEIVNLMSVDVVRIQEACVYFHWSWTAVVKIVLVNIFLWQIIGPSCLAGATYVIIVLPVGTVILTKKLRALERKQMVLKDKRIKLMNQILAGIKGLKLYAWEPFFKNKVKEIRDQELATIRASNMLQGIQLFIWFGAALFVTFLNFLTYVLVDENNVLDAEKAFVSLSLANILASTVSMMLPTSIFSFIQGMVSLKRIEKFLLSEEMDPDNIQRDGTKDPIEIRDATFSWNPLGEVILSDINVTVKHGELVAVVGTVGSGKSSFISSILGDMHKFSGRVYVNGSMAYVPQQPWIQNLSVMDNILFSRAYQKRTYNKVLKACALEPDIKILSAGDQTEIGERGINLSGGQKQRVSLARAVYQDQDLYLMDDPLSAVDAHVGKHLFENVIGPKGMLANKTRVLVTNAVTYLPEVDRIFVINNGFISEQGTYDELLSHDGPFADFVRVYLNEAMSSDDETDRDVRQQLIARITSLSDTSDWLSDGRSQAGSKGRKRRTKKRTVEGYVSEEMELKRKQLTKAETPEVGGIRMSTITSYIKAAGIIPFLLLLCCVAWNIGSLSFTNIWLSWWSNDELQNGTVYKPLLNERIGVYGVMSVAQALSILGLAFVLVLGCSLAGKRLHQLLIENIMKCPMSFFDTTPLGRILNRFALDIQIIDARMFLFIFSYMLSVSNAIATCILISYSTPIFMAVVLPILLVFFGLQRFYIACARQLKRLDSVKRSPTYAYFSESLTGVGSIRAYGQQKRFTKQSDHLLDDSQRVFFEVFTSYQWISIWCEALGALIIFFSAIFVVISRDTINAGEVGLSLSFALQVSFQLMVVVRTSTELETNIIAVERINEYTDCPQEAAWDIDSKKPPKSWPAEGAVEFRNYSTKYREGLELVLRGITCFIFPGEKVGVVGRTGAGKSSLTLALFRIIEPSGGTIEIDGLNLSNMGLHDVRRKITIIPQDPVLFSGSLRFNLDPSDCYTDVEIWTALEHAHLKNHVKTLPGQLDFICEEYGENLSVGQRQLVCLARALLRKTKILVLDEATAAIDLKTDDLIQLTIRSEFKECTIITIAHRLNTVMDYDRIMVMDNGLIKEFDAPSELLRDNQSIFFGLAKNAGIV